jgi:hypothetical protein
MHSLIKVGVVLGLLLLLIAGPAIPLFAGSGLVFLPYQIDPMIRFRLSSESYTPISGWYGPGAWVAYMLTLLCALFGSLRLIYFSPEFTEQEKGWDVDLIAATICTTVSSVDLFHQSLTLLRGSYTKIPLKSIPALVAAATAVHCSLGVSSLAMSFIFVFVMRREEREKLPLPVLCNRYRLAFVWSVMFFVAFISVWVFTLTNRRIRLPTFEVLPGDLFEGGPYIHGFIPQHTIDLQLHKIYYRGRVYLSLLSLVFSFFVFRGILQSGGIHGKNAIRLLFFLVAFISVYISIPLFAFAFVFLVWGACQPLILWGSVRYMFIPGSRWFPDSGISIREMGQLGVLLTVFIIYALRLIAWTRLRQQNSKVATKTRRILPMVTSS